ncbi:MAG: ABC transporter substrate-binding protein, partial [Desulfobacterales bacterium]|nr:ABC transporter substrate-binding protein [Desulfobacterales bacterium]
MNSRQVKGLVKSIVGLFALVTLILSPTGYLSVAGDKGNSLKIGVLAPKTGFGAPWAAEGMAGLKVAEEEIKSLGGVDGVPVEFIVYDTATKPQEAIQMMKKLIYTDKVLTIIGPSTSSECEVSFPIALRGKISSVGLLSAKPGLSARFRPWAFRNTLTSDKIYGPLIKMWAEQNKVKTAAIIYDKKSAFTKADGERVFPAALKNAGVKVLGTIPYLTGDMDFSAQITKIKMLKPDGLVLATFNKEGALIVRECKKQDLNVAMVGGLDCMVQDFVRLGGSATEGVWTAHSFWPDNPDPKFQEIMKKARAIMKDKEPGLNAA